MEKIKILLVDDELDFSTVMTTRINSWGYGVINAVSGKEAIDAVKDKAPDIVILDYLMPDMNGVEILRGIRKISRNIPVIMFTAHPEMHVIKGTEELGVSAFISKLSVFSDAQTTLKAALNIIEKNLFKE